MKQQPKAARRRIPPARKRPARRAPVNEYKSADVAKLTGVSLRQLQWWDELGHITARHAGHTRLYRPEDVENIRRAMVLRDRGVSLQRAMFLAKKQDVDVDAIGAAIELIEKYQVLRGTGFQRPQVRRPKKLAAVAAAASKKRHEWDRTGTEEED